MVVRRLCFVVNPFAGMGGPLALKGTDGRALVEALRRGAKPVAPGRARRFLSRLSARLGGSGVVLLTAAGAMGEDHVRAAAPQLDYSVVYEPPSWPTRAEDTVETVRACLGQRAELVVFVGGDGTARDVLRGLGGSATPVLGVPSGVKVYSSVFAVNPEAAADALAEWLSTGTLCEGEVVDVDEEAFRRGELRVRLYGVAQTPCSPLMVGSSKQPSTWGYDERENAEAIARYVVESMEPCTLYVLGPGTTVATIARALGVPKTLLGVDVVHNGRLVASDVDEETLYRIVKSHVEGGGRVRIVVSPIGGQGYVLGRGNQQISPRIVRLAGGKEALIVVATRSKMSRLRTLRVDTGDPELDQQLRGYVRVVVDYGEEQLARIE
jgi:predicted polyphosphate/ATP-dependent NAD kinase